MPNWKVHLEIAKEIGKYLNYNEKEQEEFNLGNILPDVNNCYIVKEISKQIDHKYTHYQDEREISSYVNFKKIYNNKIYENILIFGYYVHLYTDYTWNDFFYTKYSNDERLCNLNHSEIRIIKQSDFKVYNDKFIENRPEFTNKTELAKNTKNIDRISITEEDIRKVESFLKIQQKSDGKYQILSEQILDGLMGNTIKEIENEIKAK